MGTVAALAWIGWPEVLFILGIVVLIFGATRLPQIGKGLGEGIRNFRAALRGEEKAEGGGDREEPPKLST
jgi:sec-independent protein translocase protein TatA